MQNWFFVFNYFFFQLIRLIKHFCNFFCQTTFVSERGAAYNTAMTEEEGEEEIIWDGQFTTSEEEEEEEEAEPQHVEAEPQTETSAIIKMTCMPTWGFSPFVRLSVSPYPLTL